MAEQARPVEWAEALAFNGEPAPLVVQGLMSELGISSELALLVTLRVFLAFAGHEGLDEACPQCGGQD